MAYDSPNSTVRREFFAGESGGAATTEYSKFRSFQAARLKSVQVAVTTAGTATTHKLDIYHGTASIGSIAIGTATAGALLASTALNENLAAMDQVSVKTGADAVGKNHVIYEYDVLPSAVPTP